MTCNPSDGSRRKVGAQELAHGGMLSIDNVPYSHKYLAIIWVCFPASPPVELVGTEVGLEVGHIIDNMGENKEGRVVLGLKIHCTDGDLGRLRRTTGSVGNIV